MNSRKTAGRIALQDRSVVSSVRGLPWWSMVPLTVAVTLTVIAIDFAATGGLGGLYATLFFLACVGAVLFIARSSLFVAAVQPPLIMTVLVPLAYLVSADDSAPFSRSQAVGIILPLVQRFPLMALTSAVVVALALVRGLVVQPMRRADAR